MDLVLTFDGYFVDVLVECGRRSRSSLEDDRSIVAVVASFDI